MDIVKPRSDSIGKLPADTGRSGKPGELETGEVYATVDKRIEKTGLTGLLENRDKLIQEKEYICESSIIIA